MHILRYLSVNKFQDSRALRSQSSLFKTLVYKGYPVCLLIILLKNKIDYTLKNVYISIPFDW